MNASPGGSVHLSVCNWNLLRSVLLLSSSPSLLSLSSSALCIVLCCRCLIYYEIRTWLLVFQMLSAQAIISNSPGCRKKNERKCYAPPAEKLLIDTHSGGTLATLAQLPFPYSFCHFSAKFDLYRFYYICFFATPKQPLPCLHPWASPLVVFVVPCGANEFKCVRN